jgi:hypothetical protein
MGCLSCGDRRRAIALIIEKRLFICIHPAMNQTALNLVAISIFVMTLSTLLSPLLHFSPVIPALATSSVLAVATLDSFSFQGKGGNLVLDWLASFSPQHRDRIVRHEAGHFLVAHLLNIPITGYTLSAWETLKQKQPGLGGVSFADRELTAQLDRGIITAQMLDRYCTVWMAGLAAEDLVYSNTEGGADDRQKLRSVLTPLGYTANSVAQKQRWATLQARTLLQNNWSAYEVLVSMMQQRVEVDECCRAIEENRGDKGDKGEVLI